MLTPSLVVAYWMRGSTLAPRPPLPGGADSIAPPCQRRKRAKPLKARLKPGLRRRERVSSRRRAGLKPAAKRQRLDPLVLSLSKPCPERSRRDERKDMTPLALRRAHDERGCVPAPSVPVPGPAVPRHHHRYRE